MKKLILLALFTAVVFAACGVNEIGERYENEEVYMPNILDERAIFNAYAEDRFLFDGTVYERLRNAPATMLQLTPLTPGEELAVLHTNHGDITLRFFPQEAPLAVENFTTHARNGYYDGLIFHRICPGFMIQGGCPRGLGTAGESIWGRGFGLERSFNLHHFRGALATAHRGSGSTIGSQFYIVQNPTLSAEMKLYFEYILSIQDELAGEFSDGQHIYVRELHPAEGMAHFIEYGGTPHLDWHWHIDQYGRNYGHTVFGHVVDGMDAVDSISHAEAVNTRPLEDVIIERISFVIYGE